MFNLNVHKEVLPYTFYTQENVQKLNEGYMPTLEEYMSGHNLESRETELTRSSRQQLHFLMIALMPLHMLTTTVQETVLSSRRVIVLQSSATRRPPR